MQLLTFNVAISIDTDDTKGATSVYGISEIEHILTEGAAKVGYKCSLAVPYSEPNPEDNALQAIQLNCFLDREVKQ